MTVGADGSVFAEVVFSLISAPFHVFREGDRSGLTERKKRPQDSHPEAVLGSGNARAGLKGCWAERSAGNAEAALHVRNEVSSASG